MAGRPVEWGALLSATKLPNGISAVIRKLSCRERVLSANFVCRHIRYRRPADSRKRAHVRLSRAGSRDYRKRRKRSQRIGSHSFSALEPTDEGTRFHANHADRTTIRERVNSFRFGLNFGVFQRVCTPVCIFTARVVNHPRMNRRLLSPLSLSPIPLVHTVSISLRTPSVHTRGYASTHTSAFTSLPDLTACTRPRPK